MNLRANTIRVALLTLLVGTPWLFGGVWARIQWVLMLLAGVLLALDLAERFGDQERPDWLPLLWWPLLAGIGLGLFQLVPMSPSVASWFAPATLEWRQSLLADVPQAHSDGSGAPTGPAPTSTPLLGVRDKGRTTRSIYATATREYLALLVLATAVMVLASQHLTDRQSVLWFCTALAICGGLLCFFGLVQRLTWNGKFYWVFPPQSGGYESFGPFVNRNNAGGFLNLCLAAGLGLLVRVHWRSRGSVSDAACTGGPRGLAWKSVVADYVADLNARRLGSLALVGLIAGGVLCTASRGSILALFAASMVTVGALAFRSGSRRYAVGLMVVLLAGGGLMGWAGQTAFVTSRFDLLLNESQWEYGRVPNWRDSLQAVPQFWAAGTGLGTYRFVYERYQQRFLGDIAHFHAENQYVQTLVEGGLLGFVLLLLAIVLVARAIVRLYRAGGGVNTALAVAGTFGLASQVVGGAFDFGLYIPSNMMLLAALCGIVAGRAALLSRGARRVRGTNGDPAGPSSGGLIACLVGGLLLGCLFGSLEMNKAGKIEVALRAAATAQAMELQRPERVRAAIAPLRLALAHRWEDALAHERMAQLLMQLYVAETYQRLHAARPATELPLAAGGAESASPDEELWNRASVWHLHGTIRQLQQAGDAGAVSSLVSDATIQQTLVPAARHLLLARQSAPTLAQLHLWLAQLWPVVAPTADETIHLARARLLAPGDATLLYWIGLLDLQSGRLAAACQAWRQSLTLSMLHLPDVMAGARGRLTIRQLLDDVLPPRSDLLLAVAQQYFAGDDRAATRQEFLARAEQMLAQTALPRDELWFTAATIYRLQSKPEQALANYRDAIASNGRQPAWRYEFARYLLELRQFDEAYDHARFLARSQPQVAAYQRLLADVNAQRLRAGAPQP